MCVLGMLGRPQTVVLQNNFDQVTVKKRLKSQ